MVVLDVSCDEAEESIDAFSVLKRGSLKHKKTHDFIDHVRKIYQLPIRGRSQIELIKNSNSSVISDQERISAEEFQMVDCLSEVFNCQKLE